MKVNKNFIKKNSFAICLCIGLLLGMIFKQLGLFLCLGSAIGLGLDRRLKNR